MNKKAIAIDVLKHPIIKKLLESRIATTSTINKLIVQELMNESPKKLSSSLKNIAITVKSSVIDAAIQHRDSPNGKNVGDVEKATKEFSDKYEKVLGDLVQSFNTLNSTDAAKAFFAPGFKEAAFRYIDTIFEMFEGEELKAYQNEGIGKILLDLKNKITELTSDSLGGIKAMATDTVPVLKEVVELVKQLRELYKQYLENKTSTEEVAKAMTQAAGVQPGEEGQEGEAEADEPVTTQLVNNEEAKDKLKQDPKAEEKVDQQAQADIKNHPDKEEEIKAATEEIKNELGDPEDEIPDDVRKKDLVKVFEEENLESSFEYFLDTFVSARYFDDQAKAINDVMKALEAFDAALRDPEKGPKQASLNENQEPKPVPETILQQLTKKKKEMIEPLKTMAQLLKKFKQEQDLFSKERKDMVRDEANKLQVVLRDVKVLLLSTKPALPPSEPQALQEQTKQEKIDNIKKVYAKVRPSMITISKLIRNFKDPNDDSKVSVSQVLQSMRAIKKELETVSPYFSRKETSFTKDKITFDNLAGLIKRFANEIADIIDTLNETIKTGDITFQEAKQLIDKINELEDDIQKFIGAKKQPLPSEAAKLEQDLEDAAPSEEDEEQAEKIDLSTSDEIKKSFTISALNTIAEAVKASKQTTKNLFVFWLLLNYVTKEKEQERQALSNPLEENEEKKKKVEKQKAAVRASELVPIFKRTNLIANQNFLTRIVTLLMKNKRLKPALDGIHKSFILTTQNTDNAPALIKRVFDKFDDIIPPEKIDFGEIEIEKVLDNIPTTLFPVNKDEQEPEAEETEEQEGSEEEKGEDESGDKNDEKTFDDENDALQTDILFDAVNEEKVFEDLPELYDKVFNFLNDYKEQYVLDKSAIPELRDDDKAEVEKVEKRLKSKAGEGDPDIKITFKGSTRNIAIGNFEQALKILENLEFKKADKLEEVLTKKLELIIETYFKRIQNG